MNGTDQERLTEHRFGGMTRYVSDDAVLRLTVYNAAAGVTIRLGGRRLDCEGRVVPFAHRLVPTTDRAATVLDVPLDEGWILGVVATISAGSPKDGQTYAVLSLGRGASTAFEELEVFAANTITAAKRVAWPGSPVAGPLDGSGAVRAIAGTTPAAGQQISEVVPTGARWELLSFKAQLNTSAAVGNRIMHLTLDDGSATFFDTTHQQVVAATAGVIVNWSQGAALAVIVNGTTTVAPLPVNNRLAAGFRIRTTVTGMDAADGWVGVEYVVREWIEGA